MITQQQYDELKAERDALAAKNEVLRIAIDRYLAIGDSQVLIKAINATAHQCLTEIRAEAGVIGLKHGVMLASEMNVKPDSVLLQCWCDGYAAKVRQGGER